MQIYAKSLYYVYVGENLSDKDLFLKDLYSSNKTILNVR